MQMQDNCYRLNGQGPLKTHLAICGGSYDHSIHFYPESLAVVAMQTITCIAIIMLYLIKLLDHTCMRVVKLVSL